MSEHTPGPKALLKTAMRDRRNLLAALEQVWREHGDGVRLSDQMGAGLRKQVSEAIAKARETNARAATAKKGGSR
jgi:hypothetical protein